MLKRAKDSIGNLFNSVRRFREGFLLIRAAGPAVRQDIMLSSLATNVLMLVLPVVLLQIYDRIIPNQSFSTLILLSLGVLGAVILDMIVKTARAYVANWAGANVEHRMGVGAIRGLLKTDIRQFEKVSPGEQLDRMSGVDLLKDFYSNQGSLIVVDMPFILIYMAVLAYIAGSLVVVPIVLLIVFSVVALSLGERLRASIRARQDWDRRRYSFLIETLMGIHTVKSFAMERLMERRYERILDASSPAGVSVAYWNGLSQSLATTFSQITMAFVVAIGSLYVIDGDLTVGGLAACILLSGRMVTPVVRAMAIWSRFQSVLVAEDGLDELQRSAGIQHYAGGEDEDTPDETLDTIEAENITFTYEGAEKPVFRDISLSLKVGQAIGIRGDNGSGKSTLLRILMGNIAPDEGRVLYNGKDIRDLTSDHLRLQIAYLPQSPVLFEGTVIDNITLFRSDKYLEEALELASQLGLDRVFGRYPDGFETNVGAGAQSSLPGGVAQRIGIARALLGEPRFIFFDEANTALDGPGDQRVRETLERYRSQTALLLVSHRPSLLKIADKLYDLSEQALWPTDKTGTSLKTKNLKGSGE